MAMCTRDACVGEVTYSGRFRIDVQHRRVFLGRCGLCEGESWDDLETGMGARPLPLPGWTAVGASLPDVGALVLVATERGKVTTAHLVSITHTLKEVAPDLVGEWEQTGPWLGTVTHWRPFPSRPS